MRRRRHRNKPLSSINVVPFLDILLVLLVIFLYTAPLFNQGVVDLPSASADGQQAAALQIEYAAHNPRAPYTLHNDFSNQQISDLTADDLIAELHSQIEQTEALQDAPAIPIIIAADKGLDYGDVLSLVDNLRLAGYSHVALMVKDTER